MKTKKLHIKMGYAFVGDTEIDIPMDLLEGKTEEEQIEIAFEYAQEHIDEIPVAANAEYVPDSDDFEIEDIDFVREGDATENIDIKEVAQAIAGILESHGFGEITDSSGYFIIKEFENDAFRCVDVYKDIDEDTGKSYYCIYVSYEDGESDWKYTDSLSVEELEERLKEVYESESIKVGGNENV